MKNKMRLGLFLLGMLGVIFVPWIAFIIMSVSAFRYTAWEVLLIGLYADFVWLPAVPISFPLFTIASMIMVWGFEPLRREFLIGRGGLL
ncbi:MAG: hypothetical protein AAB798_02925 [Patescibacteria group bacterium]